MRIPQFALRNSGAFTIESIARLKLARVIRAGEADGAGPPAGCEPAHPARTTAQANTRGLVFMCSSLLGFGQSLEVLALEFVEHRVGEKFVGDRRDFFGVLPRSVQQIELAAQRASLDVFVRR